MTARGRRVARLALRGLALASAVAALGCGGGDREPLDTADTAAVLSAELADSARAAQLRGDSAAPDSAPADSVHVDTLASGATASDSAGGVVPAAILIARADSAAGDSLFRRVARCLTCHGQRGEGLPGLGHDLRDTVWLHGTGTVPEIRQIILTGIATPKASRTVMPAFASRLTEEQATEIAKYVYALSHPGAVSDSADGN